MDTYTHTHTHKHTDVAYESNFKKPGMRWPVPSHTWFNKELLYRGSSSNHIDFLTSVLPSKTSYLTHFAN